MNTESRPLRFQDIPQAFELDKKWFGEYGISKEELQRLVTETPANTLALVSLDTLLGFATFEILENKMPRNYVGDIKPSGKILFIQQFTTSTNYQLNNSENDSALISSLEEKAKILLCQEIWEALSSDHPYKKENNPEFDAFGFYLTHGYHMDSQQPLTWQPNKDISIPCYLLRKKL